MTYRKRYKYKRKTYKRKNLSMYTAGNGIKSRLNGYDKHSRGCVWG